MSIGACGEDGVLDQIQRVTFEQLQDADELPGSGGLAEPVLEVAAKISERGRQWPVAVDRSVIQRRRLAFQNA